MAFLQFNVGFDYGLLLAVPLIPLLGYVLQITFRKKLPFGDKILTGGMFVVMCITVYMAFKAIGAAYAGEEFFHQSAEDGYTFHWLYSNLPSGATVKNMTAGILYDPLGAAMLAVVGIVSFCVHLFSMGYMHGDKRYNIFFANISLFTFAMLGLVLSDNILFLFIFWELMGLMSYLLIGHFAHDDSNKYFHRWASWASKKAFMTTRVGDVCLLIGMLMFYQHFETFRFTELWAEARKLVDANGGEFPAWMTVAGLFVFGGTVGKSAQFPLHIWLPDAMAGPTPVSAMIHAATMVAAGVFLLGRTFPLMSPEALTVITIVGTTTAIFAATIGMTAYDLKAVLAWSTISQLGFMVAAVGLGGVVAGMFHMVTHAFFKGCLFLSAGSVIQGCHHEQDMRRMGGLRRHMPITFACILISTLAISGVPFFSGFYSKDAILAAGWEGVLGGHFDGWKLYATVGLSLAATMTAFYMFRMVFITFFGEYRGAVAEAGQGHDDHHEELVHAEDGGIAHGHPGPVPRESPWPITTALCVLAFFGLFAGDFPSLNFWNIYHPQPWFQELATIETLYPKVADSIEHQLALGGDAEHVEHVEHAAHQRAFFGSVFLIAPLGIFLAWLLYMRRKEWPAKITGGLGLIYHTVRHRYYVDEFVNATVIRPCVLAAGLFKAIDEKVVDGLVLLVGRVNKLGGFFAAAFDRIVVDGAVHFVGLATQTFGAISRLIQTGRVQQYAAFAVGGGLLAAAWLILS